MRCLAAFTACTAINRRVTHLQIAKLDLYRSTLPLTKNNVGRLDAALRAKQQ